MTVEDDREESELECAQKCADIKEAILGRCPCYKSVSQNATSKFKMTRLLLGRNTDWREEKLGFNEKYDLQPNRDSQFNRT